MLDAAPPQSLLLNVADNILHTVVGAEAAILGGPARLLLDAAFAEPDGVVLEPAVVLNLVRGQRERPAALFGVHLHPADAGEVDLRPGVNVGVVGADGLQAA